MIECTESGDGILTASAMQYIVVYEQDSKVFFGYLQSTRVLGLTENEKISKIALKAESILK